MIVDYAIVRSIQVCSFYIAKSKRVMILFFLYIAILLVAWQVILQFSKSHMKVIYAIYGLTSHFALGFPTSCKLILRMILVLNSASWDDIFKRWLMFWQSGMHVCDSRPQAEIWNYLNGAFLVT